VVHRKAAAAAAKGLGVCFGPCPVDSKPCQQKHNDPNTHLVPSGLGSRIGLLGSSSQPLIHRVLGCRVAGFWVVGYGAVTTGVPGCTWRRCSSCWSKDQVFGSVLVC
jgi:hypothetical protein